MHKSFLILTGRKWARGETLADCMKVLDFNLVGDMDIELYVNTRSEEEKADLPYVNGMGGIHWNGELIEIYKGPVKGMFKVPKKAKKIVG